MDADEIRRLVRNPALIPGVYNYCDRWCERCPLTSRCANFAIGERQFPDPEDRDITNQRFWDRLGEVFRATLQMIQEDAEARGIDLSSLDSATAPDAADELEEPADSHECVRSARAYAEWVDQWFASAGALFEQKAGELELAARLQLPDRAPRKEVAGLQDAVEVIRWYQHQIYVKLARAIGGRVEETAETSGGYPKDSDGSAKVALLGIDRSIAAWGAMRGHFPEEEDALLGLLVHLDRLRRRTEAEFPAARAFVRAGFDEPRSDSGRR